MTTLRRFNLCDLFRFNNVNLDSLTETYNVTFYMCAPRRDYLLQSNWLTAAD